MPRRGSRGSRKTPVKRKKAHLAASFTRWARGQKPTTRAKKRQLWKSAAMRHKNIGRWLTRMSKARKK